MIKKLVILLNELVKFMKIKMNGYLLLIYENVMKQCEKVYKDFKFIGPVPIDFDYEYSVGSCIVDELCKIDINQFIKKRMLKIGIIFNLD